MSPRTGRPKVENAKTEKMSICLNQTSKQKLEKQNKHFAHISLTIKGLRQLTFLVELRKSPIF